MFSISYGLFIYFWKFRGIMVSKDIVQAPIFQFIIFNKGKMFENKYIIMETIGRNSKKMTSIVKDKANHYYIAKKVSIDDENTMHQIQMLNNLAHPNIISLHQIIKEDKYAYIIQEYCEEGDLQFYLKRHIKHKKYIVEEIIARWMLQILLAVEYLHYHKIIHRDIRPKNIFLTSKGNIKLGSFKVSKILQQQFSYAKTLINSPYYMAPELVEIKEYDFKVDIWAFGCVLFELCSLKPFINTANITQLINKIQKNKIQDLPYSYSKQFNLIYQKCLKKNPKDRISARQLLKTTYFLQVMERFIKDNGLNINLQQRLPIKKYKIHKSKYERIKLKKKLIKQKNFQEKKEALFPKLQILSQKVQRKSLSKQKKRQSKDKDKDAVYTPVMKRGGHLNQRLQKFVSSERKKQRQLSAKVAKQKTEVTIEKDSPIQKEKEKKTMLAPPLLPKPKKAQKSQFTQRRTKTRIEQQQIHQNFEMTMSKQQLKKQLQNFQKKDVGQIKQSLNKIFENLKMLQEDEQIEFDFDEQSQLRFTNKYSTEHAESLVKTYKSKLEQLVQEINYKYCPDMQPIAQKTAEFDSSDFSKIRFLNLGSHQS